MPQAARVGDLTNHGTPLVPGPGSPTVYIGNKPAWRALVDLHTCPLVTGVVPHVGGVVSVGSTSVLIEGSAAARIEDVVEEAGPPNPIAVGCPNVMIGG